MKTFVFEKYGTPDVLHIAECEKPRPKANEILIKVCATTVTSADYRMRAASTPPGFGFFFRLAFGLWGPRKKVLGVELAGEVEAIGDDVTMFQPGDLVFAFPGTLLGAYAEFVCLPEDGLVAHKPENLTCEEAVTLPFGMSTALYYLRDLADVQAGQKVLVNGASGGVGSAAVQLARHFGAEVTAVCSAANEELVRGLGADHVIDYTREDFTASDKRYDILFDAINNIPLSRCRRVLTRDGKICSVAGGLSQMLSVLWSALFGRQKVLGGPAPERREDLLLCKELAEEGILRPVIDRRYPFAEMVEAHRYADTGRKRGSIVVSIAHEA